MEKIKLTKAEIKKQRDSLAQYERYLPTLLLKKQQLQLEILHQLSFLEQKKEALAAKKHSALSWAGLLTESQVNLKPWLSPERIVTDTRNIAGVDIPLFLRVEFVEAEYDLFSVPLWVDSALEILRSLISLERELLLMEQGVAILRQELRIATQRVNLFEKIKIPQAKEAIRLIKIYLGDQMTNAVGRSKIAKAKIEEAVLREASLATV